MEIKGEYQIAATRDGVWQALNDPDVLKACIPGCEAFERAGDNEVRARINATIGSVCASCHITLSLENLNPPDSYPLVDHGRVLSDAPATGRRDAA